MATSFGFAQQYAAPDYQTRAQAGVPLTGDDDALSQAAVQRLDAAPPPQGQQPQDYQPYKPTAWDVLQGYLFHGQSPAEAAEAARARDLQSRSIAYQAQIMQRLPSVLAKLPPGVQAAAAAGGPKVWEKIVENYAPVTRSAGQQTDYFGGQGQPGGYTNGTDTFSVDDKSGKPIETGPVVGFRTLAPSLGGDVKAENGVFNSGRLGPTGQTYATPQLKPLGSSLESFTPGVSGLSAAAAGGAGPAPTGAAPAAAPRGIRNLNFGNVKALPNGQMWQGQTGTDDQGHAIFGDPSDGVRAAAMNLQSYAREGVNTPAAIARRWAGSNASPATIANYSHFLAGAVGSDPNQPLDLTDPKVAKPLLQGIFSFENGAGAMKAWRYPQAAGQGAGATSGSQSTISTVAPAQRPRPLTDPAERAKWGISPEDKTPYVLGPDGPRASGNDVFGPKEQLDYTAKIAGMEPYTNYSLARGYVNSMSQLMKQPGGFADLGLIEMAGKTVNPTVAIRPNMIEQYAKETGWPDFLVGQVSSVINHGGHLTQEGRNALLNIAQANLQSHWSQLQPLLKKVDHDAARYGLNREDLIPDLVPMPDAPPPAYPGASVPHSATGGGQDPAGTMAEARAAIAKGADRGKVAARLQAMGINPAGL